MLEKLKFWKHEEFQPMTDTPTDPMGQRFEPFTQTDPLAQDAQQPDPYGQLRTPNYPQAQAFPGSAQPQAYQQPSHPRDPDTELILARLDAIKSDLDAITQRLRLIEQRTDTTRTPPRSW